MPAMGTGTPPNTSLEATADAVPVQMSLKSLFVSVGSLPRLPLLWLRLNRWATNNEWV